MRVILLRIIPHVINILTKLIQEIRETNSKKYLLEVLLSCMALFVFMITALEAHARWLLKTII